MQSLRDVCLVIYDLDGVLIDSTKAILQSFHASISEAGITPPPDEEIKKLIGYPLTEIYNMILPPERKHEVKDFKQAFRRVFSDVCTRDTVLLQGVKETLIQLNSRGYIQCVATNKHSELAVKILKHLGVMKFFSKVIGATDVPNPKPAPDMINKLVHEYAQESGKTVFIDDTTTGLQAGIRAGTITVGITTGYESRQSLEQFRPDYLIDNLTEIEKLLLTNHSE